MKFVGDIGFWLTTVLGITAIIVLVLYVKRADKGWLLGFLALALLSYTGYYVPMLLLRNEVVTHETYRKFIEPADVVLQVLRLTGWALLLAFVFSLRTAEHSAAASGGAASTQMTCVPARVAGGCLIAVLLLVNFAVHPLFGVFTLVGYAVAAVIIGLLAARKNRDGWAWALLGGNALIVGLLVLMFMPFLCPRCHQPISNSDWKRKACPKCGDVNQTV